MTYRYVVESDTPLTIAIGVGNVPVVRASDTPWSRRIGLSWESFGAGPQATPHYIRAREVLDGFQGDQPAPTVTQTPNRQESASEGPLRDSAASQRLIEDVGYQVMTHVLEQLDLVRGLGEGMDRAVREHDGERGNK